MTLNCVGLTQSSVIRTICLFVIIVIYAYFINITQGSVKTHLWCGEICNNRVIANCLQSVPVKKIEKSINNWQRYGQK